jgi:hypothetical protein
MMNPTDVKEFLLSIIFGLAIMSVVTLTIGW